MRVKCAFPASCSHFPDVSPCPGVSEGSDAVDPGRSQWLKEAAGFCAAWLVLPPRRLHDEDNARERSAGSGSPLDRLLRSASYEARAEALRMMTRRVGGLRAFACSDAYAP